jgi:hypothetical protein
VALLQYTLLKSTPSTPCGQKGRSTQRPDRFTPGKDTVRNVQKAGCVSRPIRTGEENLVPTGVRSLNRPTRSESYPHTQLKYTSYHNTPYATKYHIVSAFVKIYLIHCKLFHNLGSTGGTSGRPMPVTCVGSIMQRLLPIKYSWY